MTKIIHLLILFFFLFSIITLHGQGKLIKRHAKNTVTPIELNKGDTIKFTLLNGEIRTIVLVSTSVNVIITNLSQLKVNQLDGGMVYNFTADIIVDGHPMKMERYVGTQESFYEPYIVNGMRIWFDAVSNITDILKDSHRSETYESGDPSCECLPNKDARFALMDITGTIAPVEIVPWYDNDNNYISIADCYKGTNPWLGAHRGTEIHGALDINYAAGTPNYVPIPIDDHYLFNTITDQYGSENNRWRGIRNWANGDIWKIQVHHLLDLRIPEHVPIKAGTHFADLAGVFDAGLNHAHYLLRIKTPEDKTDIWLDPWLIFWQTFENNKLKLHKVMASMSPLSPHKTGELIEFKSNSSLPGLKQGVLSYYWTFGDGGWSNESSPKYVYAKPGIYPVTLVVNDGAHMDSFTQHITIDGDEVDSPALTLKAIDEPSFRIRPVHVMDIYGETLDFLPHSLHFTARPSRPKPDKKIVIVQNHGEGVLNNLKEPKIIYKSTSNGWLSTVYEGEGNNQRIVIGVNATDLTPGLYSAKVQVESEGALNSVQGFIVQLTIPPHPPSHFRLGNLDKQGRHIEIIHHTDSRYNRFYCTPYFWVGPQFSHWDAKGYGEYYLTNGGRAKEGEFVRFRPDLEHGKYQISFSDKTPFDPRMRALSSGKQLDINPEFNPEPHFAVRVHSKDDDEIIWMSPTKSTIIGEFEFDEGMDGFVDILSVNSIGQVIIDALIFKKMD